VDARYLYVAAFKVSEPMDHKFLGGVHELIDGLLGSVADGVIVQGHRLRVDKVLRTLSVTFAIAADSFDDARRLARPMVEAAVARSHGPSSGWTLTVLSEEVVDLVVDHSLLRPGASLGRGQGFVVSDRPQDGLVWELLDGVLQSKPLKTEAEARIIDNLRRLLDGADELPD